MTQQDEQDTTDEQQQPATEPDEQPDQQPEPDQQPDQQPEPDTFSREYVHQLREEAKAHRIASREAQRALENLTAELWQARVAATGVLVDPTALPLDAELLHDPEGIAAAARALTSSKPWLRANRTAGDVGQHDRGDDAPTFSLSGALRAAAGY